MSKCSASSSGVMPGLSQILSSNIPTVRYVDFIAGPCSSRFGRRFGSLLGMLAVVEQEHDKPRAATERCQPPIGTTGTDRDVVALLSRFEPEGAVFGSARSLREPPAVRP